MTNVLKRVEKIIKYWWVGLILGILFILLGIWFLKPRLKVLLPSVCFSL